MKKCIIITTINEHNNTSIKEFEKYDYDIIIVGDIKTPHATYNKPNIIYIHPDNHAMFDVLDKNISYNHYCRKNIGYLYAYKNGYEEIFETDDDNYPLDNFNNWKDTINYKTVCDPKFPNVLNLFTDKHIWLRGYPLEYVNKKQEITVSDISNVSNVSDISDISDAQKIGIYQGLANRDPDVDAIFRLTNQNYDDITFSENLGFIMNKHIYTQGNTQITSWVDPNLFHLMYIPSTVSFRFCDILKMYIAQRCIWEYNKHICITSPIVEQKRNDHDLMKDFQSEYPMYVNILELAKIFDNIKLNGNKNDLLLIYKELAANNIVDKKEIEYVEIWLSYFE